MYVPAGLGAFGGDDAVDQALAKGCTRVAGFFCSRLEVTVGEYLEFDLAGSVLELTSGETVPGYGSLRGGIWREPTEYYYRIANRLGRGWGLKEPGIDVGLRLVADVPER